MAEILQVIQLGDPSLRSPALLVENIRSERIQKLIDDLIATAVANQILHGPVKLPGLLPP